jgi:hypothetical protein
LHPRPEIRKSLFSTTVALIPLPPCLHTACTDFALRELVACWQQLSAGVRERIVRIARGQGDISRVGE